MRRSIDYGNQCGLCLCTDLSNPADMMYHVQPWMVLSVLPMVFAIEGESLATSSQVFNARELHVPAYFALLILAGGAIATSMELAEYLLLSHTSSLTLNICGVVKVL